MNRAAHSGFETTTPVDSATPTRRRLHSNVWRLRLWLKPYRLRVIVALICAALSACAAMLAPVVTGRVVIDHILLSERAGPAPDFGQRALTDWLAVATHTHPLIVACALAAFWMALSVSCNYVFQTQFARASHMGLGRLRADLFAHIEWLPAAFFDRVSTGQVLTRVTGDVESLSDLLIGIGSLAGVAIPFLVAAVVMWSVDARLTIELAPIIPLAGLANYTFRRVTGRLYHNIRDAASHLNEQLHENLSGIDIVQSCGREAVNLARYSAVADRSNHWEARAVRIETSYYPFIDNLSYLAIGSILWFGGGRVWSGEATLGSIILFVQFSDMLFRPIVAFGDQANNIFRARAACDRIFHLFDWKERLRQPDVPTPLPGALRGKIEFRNLSFRYETGRDVLRNVNLTINPGQSVAIVGPTGSGKTTMARLICRFYDLHDGSLFIDDIDIMHASPTDIRQRIGVILQDFHVFAGTVYDNISLGDDSVTLDKAIAAARAVNALPFIEALAQGFETRLSHRGQELSQGQRQLLALARVIARDPEILVLDEATASVDTKTEGIVQEALAKIKVGRTSVIIAHRLGTIRQVDRIVVLDKGRVVETGTHDELVARGGLYKALDDL